MKNRAFEEDQGVALDLEDSTTLLRSMAVWQSPTAEGIRNCALEHRIIVPQGIDDKKGELADIFKAMGGAFETAIGAGRFFDLGDIPGAVLRSEAARATELYAHGHIGHPFRDPYVLFHRWSDPTVGENLTVGSAYLVDAMNWHERLPGRYPPGSFLVCEAEATLALAKPFLLVCDTGLACPTMKAGATAYVGQVHRGALHEGFGIKRTDAAVMCNLFDPVMACLLLLATDGIEAVRIEAPHKLNKHRVKADKPPIPSHWKIRTEGYVTALMQRGQKRPAEAAGGHHASPVPHLRRGHIRHLHERHGGGTTWVRDAVVNIANPDAPLARSFYSMQEKH